MYAPLIQRLQDRYPINNVASIFPGKRMYSRDGHYWELNNIRLQAWANAWVFSLIFVPCILTYLTFLCKVKRTGWRQHREPTKLNAFRYEADSEDTCDSEQRWSQQWHQFRRGHLAPSFRSDPASIPTPGCYIDTPCQPSVLPLRSGSRSCSRSGPVYALYPSSCYCCFFPFVCSAWCPTHSACKFVFIDSTFCLPQRTDSYGVDLHGLWSPHPGIVSFDFRLLHHLPDPRR